MKSKSPHAQIKRPLFARLAALITAAILIYCIIAGASGIFMWILVKLKIVIKYQQLVSAKPGWGWLVYIHLLIQHPRYTFIHWWQQHPILTAIGCYFFVTGLFFALNYSEKDSEEAEDKMLERMAKRSSKDKTNNS